MEQTRNKARLIGKKIIYLEVTDSTNNEAKKFAATGASEGTVVVAGSQTRGKGRLGRRWISPPGGLYISIILRPYKSPSKLPLITLISSLAAVRTIRGLSMLDARIKWPNDIVIDGRKVGGILCEGGKTSLIAGIGLNINSSISLFPQSLKQQVTSLKFELGEKVNAEKFLSIMLEEFDKLYADFLHHRNEGMISEWSGLCDTLGATVRIETSHGEVHGTAVSVGARGELLVRGADDKIRKVYTAETVKVKQKQL